MNWKLLKGLTMKEKEASPRKATSVKKSAKLAMDVTIKTQMKKRADASREAVKEREKEKEKKAVTFADTGQKDEEQKADVPKLDTSDDHISAGDTPRDLNTSTESTKDEDKETTNTDGTDTDKVEENVPGDTSQTEDGEKQESEEKKEEVEDGKKEEDDDGKKEEEKEDKKSGKKGKKKGQKSKPKKEVKKKVEKPKPAVMPQGEVTAGTEEFRTFIFDKVQSALETVYTEGITETTVDNVTPLLKSLDVNTSDEGIIDLMRDALIDNFGVINPLDLDTVVQKAQEADELNEMDDCLEVAFKLIDFDEDGFITQKDIYKLMLRLGEEMAEFALDDLVDAVDMDKDGKISLRDFRFFLLGRDVPSRKEIFAMAEEAKRKREEEEARKKAQEEEEEKARQQQELADQNTADSEEVNESGQGEESTLESQENKDSEQKLESAAEISGESTSVEESKETPREPMEPVVKTEAELLREKRKNMFAGYANVVAAANIMTKSIKDPSGQKNDALGKGEDVADSVAVVKTTEYEPAAKGGEEDVKLLEDSKNEGNSKNDVISQSHDNEEHDVIDDAFHKDDDFEDDEDDDNSRQDAGPVPLQKVNLNLPPPDFAEVSLAVPSPMASPMPSPRERRPTIVGIGGLAVKHEDKEYAEAIQLLQEHMFYGDNHVPVRPHRRRSTCSSVDESIIVNSTDDVEDHNNRLVFKLPPRRKSSCTPPVGIQTNTTIRRNSEIPNKHVTATDSDEGIDLAEEEMVEPMLVLPCGAAAPSMSLRISLPQGDEDDEGGAGIDEDKMEVSLVMRKGRRRSSDYSVKTDDKGMAMLTVGPVLDTPRSMSRSEFSATHISLETPRTDFNVSEYETDHDDVETTTSKAAIHTGSNTSGFACDADSVQLSLNDLEHIHGSEENLENIEQLSHRKSSLRKGRLTARERMSSNSVLSRKKEPPATLKRSLSCQRIEIKELSLNNPVSVDQFSNRHKFGMIPRDVSKFIVLGKNPTSETYQSPDRDEENIRPKKSASVRWKELPDMIRPILKERSDDKPLPSTGTGVVREQNVLQGRRLSLFHDADSAVLQRKQDFDFPTLPNKIRIPTGNETKANVPSLKDIKKMEKKILKRSQTSFELPSVYEGTSDSLDTFRSDGSKSKRSPKVRPRSARRKSSPNAYDSDGSGKFSARHRKVSVVDLSKSLRRDTACKSTATLSKKHCGFKSIVPLARVVMAYQSSKKKNDTDGFYSISRQLEKSGVPFNSSSSPLRIDTGLNYAVDKKRRCKSARGRSTNSYNTNSTHDAPDAFLSMYDDDISTLVGNMKDPDIVPPHVVFQKLRPATAHASMTSSRGRNDSSSARSTVVTLEIPEDTKYEKKLKNVSLLSKLPIK